jgi:hypothetical protein
LKEWRWQSEMAQRLNPSLRAFDNITDVNVLNFSPFSIETPVSELSGFSAFPLSAFRFSLGT